MNTITIINSNHDKQYSNHLINLYTLKISWFGLEKCVTIRWSFVFHLLWPRNFYFNPKTLWVNEYIRTNNLCTSKSKKSDSFNFIYFRWRLPFNRSTSKARRMLLRWKAPSFFFKHMPLHTSYIHVHRN